MADPNKNLPFLDRSTYRLRRLRDAIRLLPLLGTGLFLLPMIGGAGALSSGSVMIFLFLAWGGMILAAALIGAALERALRRHTGTEQ